jgi:hypothetical protein
VEPGLCFATKLKNFNESSFVVSIDPAETESLPSVAGLGWATESNKFKVFEGFLNRTLN